MVERVFIGYDKAEAKAWEVCRASLLDHASIPLLVEPLNIDRLRCMGVYRRNWYVDEGQRYDASDGRPFSTDFSFTRFVVPALTQWQGRALFCDSDFLWRADVAELFDLFDPAKALSVVKHDYKPTNSTKMRGQQQQPYHRKNWSSLALWNCEHHATQALTPYMVNTQPGWWLHGFTWLQDSQIGELPQEWNWLAGITEGEPKAVHYTLGTPDMPGYEEAPYADEWRTYAM